MVSDGGDLASVSYDGNSFDYWSFDDKPDLEGIVKIPGREEYPYIHIHYLRIFYQPKVHILAKRSHSAINRIQSEKG